MFSMELSHSNVGEVSQLRDVLLILSRRESPSILPGLRRSSQYMNGIRRGISCSLTGFPTDRPVVNLPSLQFPEVADAANF